VSARLVLLRAVELGACHLRPYCQCFVAPLLFVRFAPCSSWAIWAAPRPILNDSLVLCPLLTCFVSIHLMSTTQVDAVPGSNAGTGGRYVPPMPGVRPNLFARSSMESTTDDVRAKLAALNSAVPAPTDAVSSFMAPGPWSAQGSGSVNPVCIEQEVAHDNDRTRREFPPVPTPVVLDTYYYPVPVDVVAMEFATPLSRARQAMQRGAAATLHRFGTGLSNGAAIFGVDLLGLDKASIAGFFVRLGSAVDLLRADGAVSGPFGDGVEVASIDVACYSRAEFVCWLPVHVPSGASDACLSAMGYLLLTDTYRYHDRQERALLRDAFVYPGGVERIMFVFDGGPIHPVDVGGEALTVEGLLSVKYRMSEAGFGDLLSTACDSGCLLNLCYGTPEDLHAPDRAQRIVAEPRSDFVAVSGQRVAYRAGQNDPVTYGGALLAMPRFAGRDYAKAFNGVCARIGQLVAATPAGNVPMNGAFELGHIIPAQLGAWQEFTLAQDPQGRPALFCSSSNWYDYLTLSVVPPPELRAGVSWWAILGYAGVCRDEDEAPVVSDALRRPRGNTHEPPRLMHSQKLSSGYFVPAYNACHAAMAFAHLITGRGLAGSAALQLDYLPPADADQRARKSFRQEHSNFVFHAADRGVTPETLGQNWVFLTGTYTYRGLRAMVLPPKHWERYAQFEHYELGNYSDPRCTHSWAA
jgi:hypothetical protein